MKLLPFAFCYVAFIPQLLLLYQFCLALLAAVAGTG